MSNVLRTLELVRNLHPLMVPICTNGGCYRLHELLKHLYPQAVCLYDLNHVITEIGGVCYDITGEVEPTPYHYPLGTYKKHRPETWPHMSADDIFRHLSPADSAAPLSDNNPAEKESTHEMDRRQSNLPT